MKSIDKVSVENLQQMEREYLNAELPPQKVTSQMAKGSPGRESSSNLKKKSVSPQVKKGPDRETIIGFSDDPRVLHRGEILPFATKKTFKA